MKLMRMSMTVILILLFVPALAIAQGEYLEGKQSGIGMATGISGTKQATMIGGGLGYSFKSILDVSLGFAKSIGSGRSISGFTFGSTLWVAREGRNDPIRVSLGISGSITNNFSSDRNDMSLMGIIMKRIYSAEKGGFLQPWISGGISNVRTDRSSGGSGLFGAGLDLCFKTGDNTHFFISPAYFRDNHNNKSGGINIGFVFGSPKKTTTSGN